MEGDGQRRGLTRLGLIPRLLRTSAFRYTLIYTAFFVLSVLGIGYFVYASTLGQTMDRLDQELIDELTYLAEINRSAGTDGLAGLAKVNTEVSRLKVVKDGALYMVVLVGPPVRVLSSDLPNPPPEMLGAQGMFEFDYTARTVNEAGQVVFSTRPAVGRVANFIYRSSDGGQIRAIILAARDIRDIARIRQDAQTVIIRIGGLTLLLGLILGSIYSGAFLRRVDNIGRTVRAIRDGDLTRRISLSGSGDEFDTLSDNINAMLDQIERLMTGMRQVSDNIAHDLRSPLTRIKARLESALNDPSADRAAVLDQTTTDVERLLATFNALLSITRIESGEGGGTKVPVDVTAVAEELLELYEPAAQDDGFVLIGNIKPAPVVLGSRELISQAIANLLDNALKYARRSEDSAITPTIELTVAPRPDGGVLLSVMDNGPGVSEADRERILQRFVRLERSRSTAGNGLGLSLVSAIARRHNAQLSIGRGLPHEKEPQGLVAPSAYGLGVRIAFPPAVPAPKAGKTSRPAAAKSAQLGQAKA